VKRVIQNETSIADHSYKIINLIFAGIIVAILAYSFFFGTDGRKYPIPSNSKILTAEITISTGLSRSFTAIMHFRFAEAKAYNPYGIRVFLFFFIQLFMRLTGFWLACRSPFLNRKLFTADAILSSGLFVFTCWPLFMGIVNNFQ
jgi:hypothetical protein